LTENTLQQPLNSSNASSPAPVRGRRISLGALSDQLGLLVVLGLLILGFG
jgi:hypothetical protein